MGDRENGTFSTPPPQIPQMPPDESTDDTAFSENDPLIRLVKTVKEVYPDLSDEEVLNALDEKREDLGLSTRFWSGSPATLCSQSVWSARGSWTERRSRKRTFSRYLAAASSFMLNVSMSTFKPRDTAQNARIESFQRSVKEYKARIWFACQKSKLICEHFLLGNAAYLLFVFSFKYHLLSTNTVL